MFVVNWAVRRSFGYRDGLRQIELIKQPKQLAARGPDPGHLVGAGEFRRKFLLPQNEDFEFGYGLHLMSLAFRRLCSAALPNPRRSVFHTHQPVLAAIGSG